MFYLVSHAEFKKENKKGKFYMLMDKRAFTGNQD